MLKDLFRKPKYVTVHADTVKKDIPEGLWQKCPVCNEILYSKDLEKNYKTCEKCGYHFRMTARERISIIADPGTFIELDEEMTSANPLGASGYSEKITQTREATGLKEAVITGEAALNGHRAVLGVMEPNFIMGSMGSVVGEKITRAVEKAAETRVPLVLFSASGGARMQEGIVSLMQMAKTCGAIAKLHKAGILYISVFTDPTTGGVSASFASMGDIVLAEPGALIGFTGQRVIEQTIRQKLPEGFQSAEFQLSHGFVDMVVPRAQLKSTLTALIDLHTNGGTVNA